MNGLALCVIAAAVVVAATPASNIHVQSVSGADGAVQEWAIEAADVDAQPVVVNGAEAVLAATPVPKEEASQQPPPEAEGTQAAGTPPAAPAPAEVVQPGWIAWTISLALTPVAWSVSFTMRMVGNVIYLVVGLPLWFAAKLTLECATGGCVSVSADALGWAVAAAWPAAFVASVGAFVISPRVGTVCLVAFAAASFVMVAKTVILGW